MAAFDVTSPDGIAKLNGSGPASLVQSSQTQGDSVQTALLKRMRYDYVWPTSTERTAQTGMVQGSRGYQVDTKTEYLYDNSAWRLALPHAEFTASKSIANATVTTVGTFTYDSSASSSSNFITIGADGILIAVSPGVYAISTLSSQGPVMTGRSFLDLALSSDDSQIIQRVSINVAEDKGSISMPNLRLTAANTSIWFKVYQSSGGSATVGTRVRISRIG